MDKEKIVEFIKYNGPSVPAQLTKNFNQNTIIIGAFLSELVKSKKLCVSNLKVGTSPLYYVLEQNYKLVNYSNYLNEKDKQAYDLLKHKLVLLDEEQTPLLRFSLRQIKDFAQPIKVTINNSEKLFWKWFLLSLKDTEEIIKKRYFSNSDILKQENNNEEQKIQNQKNKDDEELKEQQKEQEKQQERQEENIEELKEKDSIKDNTKEKSNEESNEQIKENEKNFKKNNENIQKKLNFKDDIDDEFHKKAISFFEKNNILVLNSKLIRKNSELEYYLKIPSAIGDIKFYCRAKNKKKLNESDIASIFVMGQTKKLPVLLLISGELMKKAEESLEKEYTNVVVCGL